MTVRFLPILFFGLCLALSFGMPLLAQQDEASSQRAAQAAAFDEVAKALKSAAGAYGDKEGAADFKALLKQADEAFQRGQAAGNVGDDRRLHIPILDRKGSAKVAPETWRKAAAKFAASAKALRAVDALPEAERAKAQDKAETTAYGSGFETAEKAAHQDALVTDPFHVLAILLALLAAIFAANRHSGLSKIYKVIPLLVFAYFLPTVLSNLHIIPIASPIYDIIKRYFLPTSLVLLVLSVDIPAILKLGRNAVALFLASTISIVIGGPIALMLGKGLIPESMGDQAWKGLAALSGSWIGGGANFVAIGETSGASANTLSMMIVVDVAVAEIWTIILFFYAGREKQMDAKIGADRRSLDEVQAKIETFEKKVSRPTTLADLLIICALGFGTTAIAISLSEILPPIGDVIKGFTWVVLIVTSIAVAFSFTRLRELEGAGASKVGSTLLYLLIASIGAKAEVAKVFQAPGLFAVGAIWMIFHVVVIMLVRRWLKAPIFFAAVGSKANVGGAASAPIVASAFHPSLASVGVLLAVGGYVLGTYAGLLCMWLLKLVA